MENSLKKTFWQEEGSALVTVLFIAVIFSLSLLILLSLLQQHSIFLHRKASFLTAKYQAEGGLFKALDYLNGLPQSEYPFRSDTLMIQLSGEDSATSTYRIWGGYLSLTSSAEKRNTRYDFSTLAGRDNASWHQYALLLNPENFSLTVTGDTHLQGDVITGSAGVRKAAFRGRPYSGSRPVYGKILKTRQDLRPIPDRHYLDRLYEYFRSQFSGKEIPALETVIENNSLQVNLSESGEAGIYFATAQLLQMRPWKIRGPGTIILTEPLSLDLPIQFSQQVALLSRESILLNNAVELRKALVYSPKEIVLENMQHFSGQLFSETAIILDNSQTSELSLVTVYAKNGNAYLRVRNHSRVDGGLFFLHQDSSLTSAHSNGKIHIESTAHVDGLVYSDHLLTLEGSVAGTVITDRFHFYYSPTDYFNWINGGKIIHSERKEDFPMPLFFKKETNNLAALNYE